MYGWKTTSWGGVTSSVLLEVNVVKLRERVRESYGKGLSSKGRVYIKFG